MRQVMLGRRSRGEGWLRERRPPEHCGQQSPGVRTGCGQDSGGQRRARHCTLPLCEGHTNDAKSGLLRGGPTPYACGSPTPPQVTHSPDSDTSDRDQWDVGSPLRWGTLSHQRHSLKRGQLWATVPKGNYLWGSSPCQVHPSPARAPHLCSHSCSRCLAEGDYRRRWGRHGAGSEPGLPDTGTPGRGLLDEGSAPRLQTPVSPRCSLGSRQWRQGFRQ